MPFWLILGEIKARSLEEAGEFHRHNGEEFIFVVGGELELHSESYAPLRLRAGDSVYFDSGIAQGPDERLDEDGTTRCKASVSPSHRIPAAKATARSIRPPKSCRIVSAFPVTTAAACPAAPNRTSIAPLDTATVIGSLPARNSILIGGSSGLPSTNTSFNGRTSQWD